ncbi:MAG TPA: hypothetical protein PLO86_07160 [Syntrophales bacterium]|nr:hypothetical protein [Syntrophales bacterium]HQB30527.1 hypothetical protein [Syntrophales bacterium]
MELLPLPFEKVLIGSFYDFIKPDGFVSPHAARNNPAGGLFDIRKNGSRAYCGFPDFQFHQADLERKMGEAFRLRFGKSEFFIPFLQFGLFGDNPDAGPAGPLRCGTFQCMPDKPDAQTSAPHFRENREAFEIAQIGARKLYADAARRIPVHMENEIPNAARDV